MAADVLCNHSQLQDVDGALNVTFEPDLPRPPSQASIESVDSVMYSEGLKEDLKDAWPLKCVYPVLEILHTEETYVRALEQVLTGYRDRLSDWLQSSEDGEAFIRKVFSNVGQLYNTHRRLLQSLKNSATDPHEFGQVFVKAEKEFSDYTEYCTNFNSAIEVLKDTTDADEPLKEFLKECKRELGHNLSLDAHLIKPVQRILKYHLMLHAVLKHFNTEHHAHVSLTKAHVAMTKTADHINNVQRQMENNIRVKEIQQSLYGGPSRKLTSYGELLCECKCKVHVGKKGAERERELVLFDKLLLLLKRKDSKRYNYKGHIEINELGLEKDTSEPTGFQVFSQFHRSQSYHISVRSERVRQEWLDLLDKIVNRNRLERKNVLRKRRNNTADPKAMSVSDRNRQPVERGRRKRKALSEIFPTQSEGAAELRKVSRMISETDGDITEDGLMEGVREGDSEGGKREEWMMDDKEQRVPEDSGTTLPPISEDEGSIFSVSQSSDFLQPTRCLGKRTMSPSMESLVSLSDVDFAGEREEMLKQSQLGGRYVEECDNGEEMDGVGEAEGGRERGEGQERMTQSSSSLRRKPAIRVKASGHSGTRLTRSSRSAHKSTMIREKAQMARAQSTAVAADSPSEGTEKGGSAVADMIGPASMMRSCDSSLNSSTGLSNGLSAVENVSLGVDSSPSDLDSSSPSVAASILPAIVTTQEDGSVQDEGEDDVASPVEKQYYAEGQGAAMEAVTEPLTLYGSSLQNAPDEIEIVDSSDSEEEEEEEEEEGEVGSMEEELSSSTEYPTTFPSTSTQHSTTHHDEQGTILQGDDAGALCDTQSVESDSNAASLGMEDSGFATGGSASWDSTKTTDDAELPVASDEDEPGETVTPPFVFGRNIEHYATMPRSRARKYVPKTSLPLTPPSCTIPHDLSPGPRSHKSSSPSSTASSASRKTMRKSKGFSRLIEFTRQLPTPASVNPEVDKVSQSVPPGGFPEEILEETLELSDKVFPGSLQNGRDMDREDSVVSPPPPKKQALDSTQPHVDANKVAVEEEEQKLLQDITDDVTVETAAPLEANAVAMETTLPQNADDVSEIVPPCDTSIETESLQDANKLVLEDEHTFVNSTTRDDPEIPIEQPIVDTSAVADTVADEKCTEVTFEDTAVADSIETPVGLDAETESTGTTMRDVVGITEKGLEGGELFTSQVGSVEGLVVEDSRDMDNGTETVGEMETKEVVEYEQKQSAVSQVESITEEVVEDGREKDSGIGTVSKEDTKEDEKEVVEDEQKHLERDSTPDEEAGEMAGVEVVGADRETKEKEKEAEQKQLERDSTPDEEAGEMAGVEVVGADRETKEKEKEAEQKQLERDSTPDEEAGEMAGVEVAGADREKEKEAEQKQLERDSTPDEEAGEMAGVEVAGADRETLEERISEAREVEDDSRKSFLEKEFAAVGNKERDWNQFSQEEKFDNTGGVTTESQLTHRHLRASENDTTPPDPTPPSDIVSVPQANTHVHYLTALQGHVQRWSAGNRRVMMLSVGVLTVAAFVWFGFNFSYK